MTDDLRKTVLTCLGEVAPEADLDALDAREDLRDQLDLDSMDLLNFVIALHDALGVEIPEADYGAFRSVDRAVAYLAPRAADS